MKELQKLFKNKQNKKEQYKQKTNSIRSSILEKTKL